MIIPGGLPAGTAGPSSPTLPFSAGSLLRVPPFVEPGLGWAPQETLSPTAGRTAALFLLVPRQL